MRYIISATTPCGGPACDIAVEHDLQNAVIQWFRYAERYRTCTSLQPETESDGMALLGWAVENFDKLEVWAKEHRCPYRIDWMKDEIKKQVEKGKCSMQWEYDELFPFCMG